MTWNMASARQRAYTSRKYKPVGPVGPDVTKLSVEDLQVLGGPSACYHDEACLDCGYARCNCDFTCGGCGERVSRPHGEDSCWARQRELIVAAYSTRKVQIPEYVEPHFVITVLDNWAHEARMNDCIGMDAEARGWAIRWAHVSASLRVEPARFLYKLRRYIALTAHGFDHAAIERILGREQAEADRKKLRELQERIELEERRYAQDTVSSNGLGQHAQDAASPKPADNFPVMSGLTSMHVAAQDQTFEASKY